MGACPERNSINRSTVAAVVLRALCVDPDGVRVVHISVTLLVEGK